jgi:hypothetical protein
MQVPKSVSFDRKLEIGAQALCRFDPGCPHHEGDDANCANSMIQSMH